MKKSAVANFVMVDCYNSMQPFNPEQLDSIKDNRTVVLCLSSTNRNAMQSVRALFVELQQRGIRNPVILVTDSNWSAPDEHLIHFATETGALFLDGFGDGICLGMSKEAYKASTNQLNASGRNYINNKSTEQFINSTAFSILQATRNPGRARPHRWLRASSTR